MKRALSTLIKATLASVFQRYPGLLAASLRLIVAKEFRSHSHIHSGFFRGVQLGNFTWNNSDRASIIAGSYEIEVQDWLASNVSPGERDLLSVGSADGFYPIGLLKSKLVSRAFCFETSEKSRRQLSANVDMNGLHPVQVRVGGHFDSLEFHKSKELVDFSFDDALFIIDAEGGEYDFVDRNFCETFSRSKGIIELHETDDLAKVERLTKNLESFFDITVLETTSRNPEAFPLLRGMRDDYRWGTMSEGRDYPGKWFALTPKR
jgi:hypothetical protein